MSYHILRHDSLLSLSSRIFLTVRTYSIRKSGTKRTVMACSGHIKVAQIEPKSLAQIEPSYPIIGITAYGD
jgi:hypothetical protein